MKKTLFIVGACALALVSCQKETDKPFNYTVDKFYDLEILR